MKNFVTAYPVQTDPVIKVNTERLGGATQTALFPQSVTGRAGEEHQNQNSALQSHVPSAHESMHCKHSIYMSWQAYHCSAGIIKTLAEAVTVETSIQQSSDM
jgi:hypothetical protein